MKCNFIGSFRLEELPENANPGDIAQLRLNKDQVYRDGYGNLAVDKDFVMLSEDGCWDRKDINTMNTYNKTDLLTKFYEINKDKDDFNELFKDLLCKIGHPNYKINTNKRIPRFLGIYECGKLPNAEPGDIIQIRMSIDGETIDGYNNHICDKDLIIMTDTGKWIRFDRRDDLANDDNTYIICIGSPAKIVSNPFDMEPKNLRALNTVVRSFVNANVIVIKVSTGEIIMNSNDHTVFDKYLKNIK